MAFLSPLRYPGGKGLLLDFISDVISRTVDDRITYIEPFTGGAAIALGLLSRGIVERAIIGDADPAIAAFWRAVYFRTEEFIDKIWTCDVSIDAWHENWEILDSQAHGCDLELGFAAFFLNRTNRSGILRARPIGGLDQNSEWKLDCRFNKSDLSRRIEELGIYRDAVEIFEGDACELLDRLGADDDNMFIYADPPYLTKSADLYLNDMDQERHFSFCSKLRTSFRYWMVSYDYNTQIRETFFPEESLVEFSIRHSASRAHIGRELAIFSNSCVFEDSLHMLKSPAVVH